MKKLLTPNYSVCFFLILCITLFRAREVLMYPSFWAEDGTFFFKDSIELGISSIVTPIVGHYHTLPRILAYFILFLPVHLAPLLYIILSIIVASLTQAYFVRDGFSWIVPQKGIRFIIAIFISILPGTESISFSFCTMCYVLFGFLSLKFLEDFDQSKLSSTDNPTTQSSNIGTSSSGFNLDPNRLGSELLISFIWFSVGHSIVFIPLLLYDIFRRSYYRFISLSFLIISVILNSRASLAIRGGYEINVPAPGEVFSLVQVYFDNLFFHIVHHPIFGIPNSRVIDKMGGVTYFVIGIAIVFVIFRIFRRMILELQFCKKNALGTKPDLAIASNRNLGNAFKRTVYSLFIENQTKPNEFNLYKLIRLGILYVSALLTLVMTAWLRKDSLVNLIRPNFVFDERYAYQPLLMSQMLWAFLFVNIFTYFDFPRFHLKARRRLRLIASVAILVMINNIYHENYPNYLKRLGPFSEVWPQRAREIEAGLKARVTKPTMAAEVKMSAQSNIKVGFIPCRPPWWRGGNLGGIDELNIH